MSRAALALVGLLIVVGTTTWLVGTGREPRGTRVEPARESAEVAPAPAELAPASPVSSSLPVAALPAAAREAQSTAPEDALALAQWVEGRVVFPAGTPADEVVFVVARPGVAEPQPVRVDADGRFRVAFAREAKHGSFLLQGRYVYLRGMTRWARGQTDPVELRPELGGRIEGAVRFPGPVPSEGVNVWLRTSGHAATAPLEGLRFHFDALRPEQDYELDHASAAGVANARGLRVTRGETLSVTLQLLRSVRLSGRVSDRSGTAVPNTVVCAFVDGVAGEGWANCSTTDTAGRFELGGLASGRISISVEDGVVPLERELGLMKEGTVVEDLELVVDRGLSITGHVRWPDGRGSSASVSARRIGSDAPPDVERVDALDGGFEFTGLKPGNYRLEAEARSAAERVAVQGRSERVRGKRERLVAELDVAAGSHDVVLVLTEGLELAGRVLDDRGEPLDSFQVQTSPPGLDFDVSLLSGCSARSEPDCNGHFTLGGMTSGTWQVRATSFGHAPSEPLLVELPASGPVELVVPRAARVSGVVLDAAGEPVTNARVHAGRAAAEDALRNEGEDRTNMRGVFHLTDLAPGTTMLGAFGPGGAPAERVVLELVAGADVDDVVLRLAPAAELEGEVVDAAGRGLAGQRVHLDSADMSEVAVTDADGRFALAGLPAGIARASTRTADGLELAREVRLRANEVAHVRLAPASTLVRLRGRVSAGGEPLPFAELRASRFREEDASFAATSVANGDGAYELVLPGAGRYWIGVRARAPELGWQAPLDVPEVAELAHDVDVPLARISGRVTDTNGGPLEGVAVVSEPEQHENGRHGSATATTDAEGRYALAVPPGRHAVLARGDPEHAEARKGGLVLGEGEHARDVDLVLAAGGTLEGRVRRADGTPAPEVELFADGERFPRSIARTDRDGRFRAEGLAPGALTLVAASSAGASRPQRVAIRAGETHAVEVELLPATRVHVRVRDASGALVGSDLEAVDAEGVRAVVTSGDRAGDVWLGPLLPGTYRVSARRDVRLAESTLAVNGEERLELELVFD